MSEDGVGSAEQAKNDAASPFGFPPLNANLTVDMSPYGVPVTVSAPPADQVVPYEQFMPAGGGQSQGSA